MFASLRREYIYISAIARTLYSMRHLKPDSTELVTDLVAGFAREMPDAPAILYEDRIVGFRELDESANRVAHWAHGVGIGKGDVVVLLMENRPEYPMMWLGLLKIGAVAALINTNLRGDALAHSINLANAKHAIVGTELSEALGDVLPDVSHSPHVWSVGEDYTFASQLDDELAKMPVTPPDPKWREGVTVKDKAFYIYTSGTTGLPKAANISHMRMLYMMYGFAGALNAKPSDRMYNVLPLYHSAGGICALGPSFTKGSALVLKRKFSVHEFWDDCHRYKPTFFQYIGELCRYLMNGPPSAHERDHSIRAITGNGLTPELWPDFQERFAIPRIVEFYGATEGNISMLNYDGTVGAVGRIPWYAQGFMGTRIVRFDVEKEAPVRGPDGLCIECDHDEVGEAIGHIRQKPGRTFEGYTGSGDTKKKVLTDVFEKGDAWFRSGDLLRRDRHGYFYFVDRVGDTFRWKGENVSTGEVAKALSVVPGVKEANVYGVHVPGMEGRAGMAALVADKDFDVTTLAERIAANLPVYARPVFLRLRPAMEITGTFKQRKVELVKEGFDPAVIDDPLYVLLHGDAYEKLDAARHAAIVAGDVNI